MEGKSKHNDAERKVRPPRGIPKMPEAGLRFDGQDQSMNDFVEHMEEQAEELLGVFSSVVVNGKPSPKELMDTISMAMGFFAYDGLRLKGDLDMTILENVITKGRIVADTKKLYVYLVMLNRCYVENKEIFDAVDVQKILQDARNAMLGLFDTLERLTSGEESNFTSAIKGLLYDYRRMRYEKHNRKSISGYLASGHTMVTGNGRMKFFDKDGKCVKENNADDDKDDNKAFLFEVYNFSLRCFDGFMLAYEHVSELLMHIDTAINDSESFSFKKLNAFIEDLVWMLDGMYDTMSESTIHGIVTERERSEFGSRPKIFGDSMLGAVYDVVNGSLFRSIPFEYFCNSINAPAVPTHLEVLPNQIKKACFLISRLACSLPHEKREDWIKAMINSVGINEKTYKAKRRSCVDASSTASDKEYVTKLNRIAGKYKIPIE